MDQPAAARPKRKQRPKPKLSDKEQSERFVATARELGVDETGESFEKAAALIFRPKAGSRKRGS
jgi:hypothetical protein